MDSSNYQPPTRNPQQEASGGLQPDSPVLQPLKNENGSELNPNQLPKTDNLRVTDKNNTAAGTIKVQAVPGDTPPPGGGTSLWIFSAASLIFAVILLVMAKVARPAEAVRSAQEKKGGARGAVLKDKVLAAKAEPLKSKKKKTKKNTKKKKKK